MLGVGVGEDGFEVVEEGNRNEEEEEKARSAKIYKHMKAISAIQL